jgi:hypothetical protein
VAFRCLLGLPTVTESCVSVFVRFSCGAVCHLSPGSSPFTPSAHLLVICVPMGPFWHTMP